MKIGRKYKQNEKRFEKRFAFFPVLVDGQTIWLEYYYIIFYLCGNQWMRVEIVAADDLEDNYHYRRSLVENSPLSKALKEEDEH